MVKIEVNCATGEISKVPLTAAEIAAVEAYAAQTPTAQDLLNKLDADNTLTQRNLRETIMLMNEAFKLVSSNSVDLSNIPGVAQVYAVEAQAAVLRGQL